MNDLHVTGPSSATDMYEGDSTDAHVNHGDSKRSLHAGVPPMFEELGDANGHARADVGTHAVGTAHE